jgi:predicted RNase H-related nuclease YkuK (DUF458 family)
MATKTLRTNIDGKDYKVILGTTSDNRKFVWVRSVRKMEDGTEVDAFLSNRQHKAESRARSRFAKEINEHLGR